MIHGGKQGNNENSSAEGAATAKPMAPGPYDVLKIRSFLLYLIGRFAASLGQQMVTVAVGWELYERTGSALALGLVGLTQMIPMIAFTLPAGHMADNHDRKVIIVRMTMVIGLASLGLAVCSYLKAPILWTYACLFVMGTARTFLWPASSAFMPLLVPRNRFAQAVTWNSGSFHLSSVAGPAAGGALIALTHSATSVYVINTIASIICLSLIASLAIKRAPTKREPMTAHNLAAGFQFVFASPIILGTITLDLFAVLLGGATTLLPIYAKDILHAGPSGLGVLRAALPAGSLLCSFVLAHSKPLQHAGRALLWSVVVFGVATIVFGISKNFTLSLVMLFICGAADNISVVIRHTLVQLLTPDEKRGRVSAVNSLFIGTSNELGGFESGVVANWFGSVLSVVSGGIGTILVVVAVGYFWPQIRHYGRLDTHE